MSLESQLSKRRRIMLLRKRCPTSSNSNTKRTLRYIPDSNEEVKDGPSHGDLFGEDNDQLLFYNLEESNSVPIIPTLTIDLTKVSD